MSEPLLTDNHWEEYDFGWCKRACRDGNSRINRIGYCESCYYAQTCCVKGCKNLPHVEGEDACSVHELEFAREALADAKANTSDWSEEAARVALWQAYMAADGTMASGLADEALAPLVASIMREAEAETRALAPASPFAPIFRLFGRAV